MWTVELNAPCLQGNVYTGVWFAPPNELAILDAFRVIGDTGTVRGPGAIDNAVAPAAIAGSNWRFTLDMDMGTLAVSVNGGQDPVRCGAWRNFTVTIE
jgi:hypothetical protein